MWLIFALAALVMLVAGVGGSLVAKLKLMPVPPDIYEKLPLIENLGLAAGVALSLLGVAMAMRRLKKYEHGRGSASRMRRSGKLKPPKRQRDEPEEFEGPEGPEDEPEPIDVEEEPEPIGFDAEPATKRLRRI